MSDTAENAEFQISSEDLLHLKRDLLATTFNQAHAELMLYQKGRCLQIAKSNRSKTRSQKSTIKAIEEPMPDAEILEDIKFDKELDNLRNIFKVAYETLTTEVVDRENPYQDLTKLMEAQSQSSNEVDLLKNELTKNRSALNSLKDAQIKQKTEYDEKLAKKSQRVKELRDQLHNIKRLNCLELRLVEKWEDNRLTQATIVGEKEERMLMQNILELQRHIGREKRIICEIKAYRNNEIAELRKQIVDREAKFKEENTKIIKENATLTQNIADVVKKHEKHRQIRQQRKLFVSEYLQKKAEEQRLYEEQCHRVACAIRIQAWWRGVMVRKGLGPYRKKSKKGKKSKDKNKLKQTN